MNYKYISEYTLQQKADSPLYIFLIQSLKNAENSIITILNDIFLSYFFYSDLIRKKSYQIFSMNLFFIHISEGI